MGRQKIFRDRRGGLVRGVAATVPGPFYSRGGGVTMPLAAARRERRPGPTMSDDSTILQALLDRMKQGDRAARREMLERVCDRLRRLVNAMLGSAFPVV